MLGLSNWCLLAETLVTWVVDCVCGVIEAIAMVAGLTGTVLGSLIGVSDERCAIERCG
jgi:hypothetical protein